MMFLLGLFIGAILGMFLTAALTAGKISDCEDHEEYLKRKLKFRLRGDDKNDGD